MRESDNSTATYEAADSSQADEAASVREKLERLKTEIADLYDSMHFGCFSVGDDGVCTDINDTALVWLERTPAEVIGKQGLQDWLTPESLEKIQRHGIEFNSADMEAFEVDLVSKSGVIRPVGLTTRTFADVVAKGAIRRSVLFDLTDHKKAAERRKIESIAFESLAGICVTDMAGNILHFNKSFTKLTGYAPEEIKGNVVHLIESHGLNQPFYGLILRDLNMRGSWEGEIREQHKDGSDLICWLSVAAVGEDGRAPSYYVATIYDITENRTSQDKISRLAAFDSLTQLPNRRTLQERIARELSVAARSGLHGALLFLDLDNFKSINDTKGHAAGDKLLIETGQRLRDSVRKEDIVARMGGDEFVALLTDLSADMKRAAFQAGVIGEKILAALSQPYLFSDFEFRCPASMGIALFGGRETIDDLLQQADLAMYKAKKAGTSGFRFFDDTMHAVAMANTFLEQELRCATAGQQFELYFQPQVNEIGRIIAAEALIRWRHPKLGLIPPSKFIPLAEEVGLILPVGLWVLEAACKQIKVWANNPCTNQLQLSVNVSARQFSQSGFVDAVLDVINDTGADPTRLMLELTEGMMHDIPDSRAKMLRLKETGITFSLDDFGTGYSSLSMLTKLPLEQLKIDQSFVSDMSTEEAAVSVVETIIDMGHNLGLSVIAEGVETQAQWDLLRSKSCKEFQGFLFSPPLAIDAFEALVFTNNSVSNHRE